MDFLKAFPSVSKDEYLWSMTVPQVKLASLDNTHIEYMSEEQAKKYKLRKNAKRYEDTTTMLNDLGIPVFNNNK